MGVGAGSRVSVIDIWEDGGEEGGLHSGDFGLGVLGGGEGELEVLGLGLEGGVERANGSVSSSSPPSSSPTP